MHVAFDVERFERLRKDRGTRFGAPITAVAETGSTNDDALSAARRGDPEGALFVADLQTSGRGRRGHRWTSPAGQNLTFSLVLRPDLTPERVSPITLLVGLAVRAAAQRRVSTRLSVKWPNDVLAGDRKLAGILVETQVTGATLGALVVGVGINVAMRDLPDEIAPLATSLAILGAADVDRETLLADVLAELECRLTPFADDGLGTAIDELRTCDALCGRRLEVDGIVGAGAGIDETGGLRVRDESGAVRSVSSGTVTILG
jgi:BirA family biotin operon repressor/biotin-[acetyl-CoA-carboxylase] ligase